MKARSNSAIERSTSNPYIVSRMCEAEGAAVQPGPAKIYLNVATVNPAMGEKPVVIWRNLTVGFRPIVSRTQVKAGESAVVLAEEAQALANLRRGIAPPGARQTLKALVNDETAIRLNFGKAPTAPLGPDDFASEGSVMFSVPMPEGRFSEPAG